MPKKINFTINSVRLIFLLIFGTFWGLCDAQLYGDEAAEPPVDSPSDGHGEDAGAFFALRSCHQLLRGDSGEFFSPDYLCSNPPLWCNWTIQVDPGKRIHLHLEDFTPDDACHRKQDQVHVDDPAGGLGGLRVLQKCWQEASYTSSSNTLHVVLLIAGWPSQQYRGFYGRYQAFGPLVVYNPHEGLRGGDGNSEPHGINDFGPVMAGEFSDLLDHPAPDNSDQIYDYDPHDTLNAEEMTWEAADAELGGADRQTNPVEADANDHPASENYGHVHPLTAVPTVPTSTQGTHRSERGATQTPSDQPDPDGHQAFPHPQQESLTHHPAEPPTILRRKVEGTPSGEAAVPEEESSLKPWWKEETLTEDSQPTDGENRTEVTVSPDQLPSSSGAPELEETEHPHPDMFEPLSDLREALNIRNHSVQHRHLPGDLLFEVAVEVKFNQDFEESWDDRARSLMKLVKALISKRLEALPIQLSMTSKRIKRLNAGVLYIIWLNIGQQRGSPQTHRAVHAGLQGLVDTVIGLTGNHIRKAVIISMSTGDVNECGSQLALCDVNADCTDQFGSYSCRCKPGFQDKSHLGSGGTICVDMKTTGCSSSHSAETKGVYVLFFLLSSLIVLLLVAAFMLYHRHHQGAFLVRCHGSDSISDPNNNNNHRCIHRDSYSSPADSDLPPPPPPARGPRESWSKGKQHRPAVDLPLLRFSSLLPPDDYMESQEGGKM